MSTDSVPEAAEAPPRNTLLIVLIIAGVAVALAAVAARFWTEYLWFGNLGFQIVFTTTLAAQAGLFLVMGGFTAALVYVCLRIAYRLRPVVRHANLDSELLVQLRDVFDERSKAMMRAVAAVVGLLGGGAAASMSTTFLGWWRATEFNQRDAILGMDASFYVFHLPWWRFVLGYVIFSLVVATISVAMLHFLTGSITVMGLRNLGGAAKRSTLGAQRQLSVQLGLLLLLYAASAVLERFAFLTTTSWRFTGVTFTDATARMPAQLVLAGIAAIVAVLLFYNAWKVRWSVPGAAIALLVVSSLILSTGYPWVIQSFEVNPDEPIKEKPYIQANIAATRYAYGIDDVEITDYEATTSVSAGQLRADAEALPAIRLMDPAVIAPTFEQLQQVRGYYAFPATLDVDRYVIDGRRTDAVVAARELDLASVEAGDTWNNKRTVYTHGYGMVAAYGNQRESNGEPVFFSGGIPTVGLLPENEPRIYYGEKTGHWVVAGAPADREPFELDTPAGGEGRTESKFTYTGEGGVPIGNFFTKAAFAMRFGDINLMLSERVNSESRLLFKRIPVERVNAVAPWLTVDSDPYPSVVDGRIVWIVDAYTTTSQFPNSTQLNWQTATSDTRTSANERTLGKEVNYLRNSVKATVDAYDGTVKLYEWDETDPILQTWSKVFPGTVTPKSEISAELLEHLRYPQDLFKIQRSILGLYHTTNSDTWYQQSDVWEVPNDPVRGGEEKLKEPPYFLTIRWPGDDEPHYANTTVFVPRGRENLSVYMGVNADAQSDDYGKIRVLKLSDAEQIAGPGQTYNAISTNESVAERLLPFNRQGTATAIYGNLLTLPLGGGLIYVQPIYTKTSSTTGAYPSLRFVVVRFGEYVGIGDTLQAALDEVFQGDAGAKTGESINSEEQESPQSESDLVGSARAKELLGQAMDLFVRADKALKAADLGEYQELTVQARRKMNEALAALDD